MQWGWPASRPILIPDLCPQVSNKSDSQRCVLFSSSYQPQRSCGDSINSSSLSVYMPARYPHIRVSYYARIQSIDADIGPLPSDSSNRYEWGILSWVVVLYKVLILECSLHSYWYRLPPLTFKPFRNISRHVTFKVYDLNQCSYTGVRIYRSMLMHCSVYCVEPFVFLNTFLSLGWGMWNIWSKDHQHCLRWRDNLGYEIDSSFCFGLIFFF